ncbi:MAG: recombinase family protein [Armatimonadota bacterium]
MKNCFIYCRVSTEEQADKGHSLDTQERLCRDFAKHGEYAVKEIFRDEGKSATNLERPALKELLSRCTESQIDAVIVQETDRLARNTKDHLTIKAVLKKAGIKLISVAQPMLDDSPEGMMIDTILASVNQFQSDINGRKAKRGLEEKFNMGWWPGWAPVGYINVTVEGNGDVSKSLRIIKKDPDKWHLVREGFDLYLTGNYSADEVTDILNEKGLRSKYGRKIAHSVMVNTLKNPFYAGVISWNGKKCVGKHEPMITLKEHERVLHIMESHNVHACRRRKHNFLLRGFAFCNICGYRYTAEIHQVKKKSYYHCAAMRTHSNLGQNIETLELERAVEKQFRKIQFTEDFAQLIVDKLRTIYLGKRESTTSQKQALYNQKKAIEMRRDKAEEKLFDGLISDEDFSRIRAKFSAELAQIQSRIEELDAQQDIDIDVVQEILRLSRNIYKAYLKAPQELKRQYLALFWDKFLIQDKKIVKAIPTDLVLALQQEQKVIISIDWFPSPALTITIEDRKYMKAIRKKLQEILDYNLLLNAA